MRVASKIPIACIASLAASFFSTATLAATPVRLPPGESEAAWEAAFKIADLEVAPVGAESPVLIEDRGETWVLWARDPSGIVREVEVATPRSPLEREDVGWLIVSLLNPSPRVDLGLPPRMSDSPRGEGAAGRTPPRVPDALSPSLPAGSEEHLSPDSGTAPVSASATVPPGDSIEPAPERALPPEVCPSDHLTEVRFGSEDPVVVVTELSTDYEPFRGPLLPFASLTATTDMRLRTLPSPAFELAVGLDIVGRVRVGLGFGGTTPAPVSWDPSQAESTSASSVEVLGFGSIAMDPRGRVRLGGALGARNIGYVPVAPGRFPRGESEWVPTVRMEGSYGFALGRSLAFLPTVGVQLDVLPLGDASIRPADLLPVSVRIGVRVVALRDVSFTLAPLPKPPPPFGASKKK